MTTTTQPAHQQEESKPHGWLYDWTHSSATGKPDTTYTGFTKDEAHARKHDNCTAIYTSPKPSPAAQGDALDAAKHCLEMGESFRALRRVVNLLLEARRNLGPEDHELRDRIDQLLRADAARAAQEGK